MKRILPLLTCFVLSTLPIAATAQSYRCQGANSDALLGDSGCVGLPVRISNLGINRSRIGNREVLNWRGTVTNISSARVFVSGATVRVTRMSSGRRVHVATMHVQIGQPLQPGASADIDARIIPRDLPNDSEFQVLSVVMLPNR